MAATLVLASSSSTRFAILQRAGFVVTAVAPRVDEDAIRDALQSEGASARDIADALAEAKARKVASRHAGLVIGADQILVCEGRIFTKSNDRSDAVAHLSDLQGRTHTLFTAIVAYRDGQPVWRDIAEARLTMRKLSPMQISSYLDAVWPAVASSVGCYQIEGAGIGLFRAIKGEYSAILGLPMPQLIAWLDDSKALS